MNCVNLPTPQGTRCRWPWAWPGGFRRWSFTGVFARRSLLGSELTSLLESIGDPTLTLALLYAPLTAKLQTGELAEVLQLAQMHDRPG